MCAATGLRMVRKRRVIAVSGLEECIVISRSLVLTTRLFVVLIHIHKGVSGEERECEVWG